MKKLPAKTQHLVSPLLITFLMTFLVSGISTFRAAGLAGLGTNWMTSWLWSWIVAYPALLLVAPLVRKILPHFVDGL